MTAANQNGLVVLTPAQLEELVERAVRSALHSHASAAQAEAPSEWIDTDAAAALLNVHARTVTKLVEREGLSARRIGRLYRYRRADVELWIERRTAQARRQRAKIA